MADRKSIKDYSKRENYIQGNTVRQFEYAPDPRRQEEPERKKKVSRNTRYNREKVLQMNLGYVAFLTVIAVATVFVCIQYLRIQSDITQRSKNIASMQSELDALKTTNDTLYNNIQDSIDLMKVRKIAMKELGMVEAEKEQIKRYKSPEDDYTKQYEEVPESGNVD